jgi:hypothetical protein
MGLCLTETDGWEEAGAEKKRGKVSKKNEKKKCEKNKIKKRTRY